MSFSRVPPGPGRPNGFTLIEALVALTILGVALLLGMQLLIQTPRIISRIDAERKAFRALEATLDGVRAGVIALRDPEGNPDQVLTGFFTAAGPVREPEEFHLAVFMHVESADLPGLCHVTLTAQYLVLNVQHEKQLETLVRRPC